jgi:phosphoribosylformimino-5-aminoimidazole carboxamide ribotide isomerase
MTSFQVIPAVDIRGGRCVRLEQGLADRETVYGDDPLEAALRWQALGAQRLHVVDLDGAFTGSGGNFPVVERILKRMRIPVEVGGGIRDAASAARCLDAGASWVVMGTRAAEDHDGFRKVAETAPGRVLLGLDCRDGKVRTSGWTRSVDLSARQLLERLAGSPLAGVIYTDTSRDGMLSGPNLAALGEVVTASPWPVIASGGVSRTEHIRTLAGMRLTGVIVGQALYRGVLDFNDALSAASAAASTGKRQV